MSLRTDLAKVRKLLRPKIELRIVRDRAEVVDIPGIIWVLFNI